LSVGGEPWGKPQCVLAILQNIVHPSFVAGIITSPVGTTSTKVSFLLSSLSLAEQSFSFFTLKLAKRDARPTCQTSHHRTGGKGTYCLYIDIPSSGIRSSGLEDDSGRKIQQHEFLRLIVTFLPSEIVALPINFL
jgi:hypothetical protein